MDASQEVLDRGARDVSAALRREGEEQREEQGLELRERLELLALGSGALALELGLEGSNALGEFNSLRSRFPEQLEGLVESRGDLLVGGVAAADWALIERDGRPPQWYLSCFYQRESRYGEECTFPTAQSPTVVQVKRWSWLPGADTYPE